MLNASPIWMFKSVLPEEAEASSPVVPAAAVPAELSEPVLEPEEPEQAVRLKVRTAAQQTAVRAFHFFFLKSSSLVWVHTRKRVTKNKMTKLSKYLTLYTKTNRLDL